LLYYIEVSNTLLFLLRAILYQIVENCLGVYVRSKVGIRLLRYSDRLVVRVDAIIIANWLEYIEYWIARFVNYRLINQRPRGLKATELFRIRRLTLLDTKAVGFSANIALKSINEVRKLCQSVLIIGG
jgi:hypothetical protein